MTSIEKYKYFKAKYPKRIIFIKKGSLYRTYGIDIEILKDIFNIKGNTFNINNIRKIFDYLKSIDEEYLLIDNNLEITGKLSTI